ncbi:hypothetical protein QZH41_007586 [Actinostola sp. cb2023]|nr:hypothetical protein QZH41_007586 [Actinostola sp. cb2023]
MREDDKVDPLEVQLEAQQELAALQRQYRCLRNDKRTYTTEAENIIRRQKAAIEVLLQEKKDLVTLSNVAGRLWNQCFDENNLNEINNLLDREQVIHEEIKKEKVLISEVDQAEKALEEKIIEQRKTMKGSKDVSHTKYVAIQKQIRVLKNRLDNMSKKFNSAMAGNQKLREKIDHVNGQKARFKELYQRLENSLVEVKSEIEKVSETATAHFNARDEAQHRMASLRERGERDFAMFSNEIKDVMRAIEHDRKLREFMNTKAEDRASILEEETMTRELRKLSMHLEGLKLEANKFEEIFEKIKEATGIYDTDILVSSFIENEDTNFALFNYVNAMNTEIESLQEYIQFLKGEIEQTKNEGVQNDVRRKEILQELEQQLASVMTQWDMLNKQTKADRCILETVKPKIEKLFSAIKCDRRAISELLGGGTTIDDYNTLQYLGIIEQKCNELLQIKALHRLKTVGEIDPKEAHVLEGLQGAGPQPAHPILSVAPPTIEEESDLMLQASDTKPLSMDEVQVLFTQVALRGGPSRGAGTGVTSKQSKKKRF